jgi:hypothetical protein
MSSKLDSIQLDSLSEEKIWKVRKFFRNLKSSNSLLGIISGSDEFSEIVISHLLKVFFGNNEEAIKIKSKRGYAEDFYTRLSAESIDTIRKRFVENLQIENSFTFDDAIDKGTLDISWMESFNGISPLDIRDIYSVDASFPSGKRRRGKGETLSCLTFGGYINSERGADINIGQNRVEVKSTVSASITSEDNGVSNKIKQFIILSYRIAGMNRKKEKTYGKGSFELLVDRISKSEFKANEFWKRFHQIIGFKTDRDIRKILPILVCLQIEHYSVPENFNTMIIFREDPSGFPDSMSILKKDVTFVTEKNIDILSGLNIYFRVYPSKVEIFS